MEAFRNLPDALASLVLHLHITIKLSKQRWHSDGCSLTSVGMHLGSPGVKAAFLVDPVDNTQETPEGPDYPSAAKALRVAGKPVAMCGASLIGKCNPTGSNWQVLACYQMHPFVT